jgi:hypothetical protein
MRLTLILAVTLFASMARAQQCEPCINGETPSDDDDCTDLVDASLELTAGTQECAATQLANFQYDCCDEAPRGLCTLCPDGASFQALTVVPAFDPDGEDITCADLNGDEGFLDFIFEAGTCSDTKLRRSAAWCGCPGVNRECTLCPDGSKPPNPTLVDNVYYGLDCDAFDFVSAYFSADECPRLTTEFYEFDAAAFCGCPDSPIPDVCDLCPDGEEVIYPNLKLGSGKFNCRELALSTRYLPSIQPCVRALSFYREKGFVDECCGTPIWSQSNKSSKSSAMRSSTSSTFLSVVLFALAHLWHSCR